jgi:hypothetical protein
MARAPLSRCYGPIECREVVLIATETSGSNDHFRTLAPMQPPTFRQAVAMFLLLAALSVAIGVALWHRQDQLVDEIRRVDHGPAVFSDPQLGQMRDELRAVTQKLGITTTTFPPVPATGQQTPPGKAP